MVFKDQKYIRCDVPGEAKHDFDRDLSSNKKFQRLNKMLHIKAMPKIRSWQFVDD